MDKNKVQLAVITATRLRRATEKADGDVTPEVDQLTESWRRAYGLLDAEEKAEYDKQMAALAAD